MNEIHLQLAGEIDIAVTPDLRSQLLAATPDPGHTRLVLDVSKVTLLDASALSMLLAAARAYEAVELRNACPATRKVIEVCGLDDVVTVR